MIACGDDHTVCLARGGDVIVCGSGHDGQLGGADKPSAPCKMELRHVIDEVKHKIAAPVHKLDPCTRLWCLPRKMELRHVIDEVKHNIAAFLRG